MKIPQRQRNADSVCQKIIRLLVEYFLLEIL